MRYHEFSRAVRIYACDTGMSDKAIEDLIESAWAIYAVMQLPLMPRTDFDFKELEAAAGGASDDLDDRSYFTAVSTALKARDGRIK